MFKNKTVQVLSDKITAVAYVNRLGGSNVDLNNVIFLECEQNNIKLVAKYFGRFFEPKSGDLSRQASPYKWKLHPRAFEMLDVLWGPDSIDRFTSTNTAQLDWYNSYFADPFTLGVDAMSMNWKGENNYINPPFFMIGKVLKKIVQDQAEATIIAPAWRNKWWFQELKCLAVSPPFKLPNSKKMMLRLVAKPEPCKNYRWKIYAWRVSGKQNFRG